MSGERADQNHRILVIDDVAEIHSVFKKIFRPRTKAPELSGLEASLFGAAEASPVEIAFEVDSALQGEEGLARVRSALVEGRPYAMAFVDMRMPPGWDGLQTIEAIWREDHDLEIVICTAHSDYSDLDIVKRIGTSDQVLFLRKPFEAIEVRLLARALTEKWALRQQARVRQAELERRVATRTRELSTANLRLVDEAEQKRSVEVELRRSQTLEAVGRLASGFAQELGASLVSLAAAVSGARALVSAHPLKDELADCDRALAAATTAAAAITSRMEGLVRGLVRLGSERPEPCATIDVNVAVASVAELMRESIQGCAELKIEYGALPPIRCAAADLNLVLLGLIDSAVRAVESVKEKTGPGRISIATRTEDGCGVIAITDSGDPVPDEVGARIFEPFYVAGDGARQGLGVARSLIVQKHGGELSLVRSADGESTVLVRLPLAVQPQP